MQPTIVLVHGAFAESSSWDDVVEPLVVDGYRVVAAANPLEGAIVDEADVLRAIAQAISVLRNALQGDPA